MLHPTLTSKIDPTFNDKVPNMVINYFYYIGQFGPSFLLRTVLLRTDKTEILSLYIVF